eukprot:gene23662-64532_t
MESRGAPLPLLPLPLLGVPVGVPDGMPKAPGGQLPLRDLEHGDHDPVHEERPAAPAADADVAALHRSARDAPLRVAWPSGAEQRRSGPHDTPYAHNLTQQHRDGLAQLRSRLGKARVYIAG